MYFKTNTAVLVQPDHYRIVMYDSNHPDASTHCDKLIKTNFPTPVLYGKRCPSNACLLEDGDPDKARYYRVFMLTLLCPWSGTNPLFDLSSPVTDEVIKQRFDTWIANGVPEYCQIIMDTYQGYHDSKEAGLLRRQKEREAHGDVESDTTDYTDNANADECGEDAADLIETGTATAPKLSYGTNKAYLDLTAKLDAENDTLRTKKISPDLLKQHTDLQPFIHATTKLQIASWSKPSTQTSEANADALVLPSVPARVILVSSAIKAMLSGSYSNDEFDSSKELPEYAPITDVVLKFGLDTDERQLFVFKKAAAALLTAFLNGDVDALTEIQLTELAETKKSLLQFSVSQALFLTGAGGCGKSNIIKAVRAYAVSYNMGHTLCIAAPTGFAAHQIYGCTFHHLFKIPVYYSYNANDDLPRCTSKHIATSQW